MNPVVYRVKDWDRNFENNKSRVIDRCSYVCVPNKQHGMGFSRLMYEKDGTTIYGVWHLIVGACSQQHKPRQGWLTQDGHSKGTPWTPEDLAMKFRRPTPEIERALEILTSPVVGWIETYEVTLLQPVINGQEPSALLLPIECPPSAAETSVKERKKEGKNERKKEYLCQAREVLAYLNEVVGSNFKEVTATLDPIVARLRESSVEECKAVIDSKTREWRSDVKMKKYLRPETLFRASHFHNYLGQASSTASKSNGF